MALFQSTPELKKFCPSINRNMEWQTFAPAVEQAELKYLKPLLGTAQYNALVTAYEDNDLSTEQGQLLKFVQRPLAYYAFHEALPLLTAMVSDMGVTEQESSEGTALRTRQWVFSGMQKSALENGDLFTDAMLSFLEDNHTNYPLWAGFPAFTVTKSLFINTTAEFNSFVPIGNSKRVWLALRPSSPLQRPNCSSQPFPSPSTTT